MVVGDDAHFLVVTRVRAISFSVRLTEVESDATLRNVVSLLLGVLTYARVMAEVAGAKLRVATSQHSHLQNFV